MQAAVCGCPTLRRPPCFAAAPAMGYSPVCVPLRAVITSCAVLAVCPRAQRPSAYNARTPGPRAPRLPGHAVRRAMHGRRACMFPLCQIRAVWWSDSALSSFCFSFVTLTRLVRRGCRVSLGCGCGTALSIGAVRIGFLCVVSLTLGVGVVGAGSPGECHAGARSSSQFDLCTVRPARHRLWGEAASFSLSSYCRYSSTHTHTHLQYSV